MTVTHTCTVVGDGARECWSSHVRPGQTVLDATATLPGAPIRVGCRGGGCGVCRVLVLDGDYTTKRVSRRFVTEADEAAGYALACRLFPASDLTVRWDPVGDRRTT